MVFWDIYGCPQVRAEYTRDKAILEEFLKPAVIQEGTKAMMDHADLMAKARTIKLEAMLYKALVKTGPTLTAAKRKKMIQGQEQSYIKDCKEFDKAMDPGEQVHKGLYELCRKAVAQG